MLLIILVLVSAFCGLVLSFGTDVCQFVLNTIGSFERLSWLSLLGTAFLVGYWLFCYFKLYRQVNNTYDEETESTESGGKRVGRKSLIFGLILTLIWILLFVTTDLSASWAESFLTWQTENQTVLEFCNKIGNLLLAFAAGILVSMLSKRKKSSNK